MRLHTILLHPQVPNNTGAVGRTCVGMNAGLHIIKPIGFDISSSRVKRAGLDYWHKVDLHVYEDFTDFATRKLKDLDRVLVFSKLEKYGSIPLHKANVGSIQQGEREIGLLFGSETAGVDALMDDIGGKQLLENSMRIYLPQTQDIRSYNLSNAVSVAMFEVARQLNILDSLEQRQI
eukprot:gb/GECG01012299.1/.p1 GENE.gb/GECG01012299.1/~~gb/GECG01012299.1/.p1  ORF type:complete len:177 (+),score=16.37 gb/GECG01012299.1/:1-531(+)